MAGQSEQRTQSEQKSLNIGQNQRQGSSMERASRDSGISFRGRFPMPGFGMTPLEFFTSNPFLLMRRMTEEMDRMMREPGLERAAGSQAGWVPAIELTEQDGKYNVRAELPGLSPQEVKIEATNDELVIQGERKYEHEEKEEGRRQTERQYGFFYRTIPLPEGADVEHANARFQNGLLEVSIPIPQQRQNRRSIPIEGASQQSTGQQKAGTHAQAA